MSQRRSNQDQEPAPGLAVRPESDVDKEQEQGPVQQVAGVRKRGEPGALLGELHSKFGNQRVSESLRGENGALGMVLASAVVHEVAELHHRGTDMLQSNAELAQLLAMAQSASAGEASSDLIGPWASGGVVDPFGGVDPLLGGAPAVAPHTPAGPLIDAAFAGQSQGDAGYADNFQAAIGRDARGDEPLMDPEHLQGLISRSQGRALPKAVASTLSSRLGVDLSAARIHTDAAAAQAAEGVNAYAFAVGEDVFFGAGNYEPGTPEGDHLIIHELTHVAQHLEGRLRAGPGMSVSSPSDATELEAEATAHELAPTVDLAATAAAEPAPSLAAPNGPESVTEAAVKEEEEEAPFLEPKAAAEQEQEQDDEDPVLGEPALERAPAEPLPNPIDPRAQPFDPLKQEGWAREAEVAEAAEMPEAVRVAMPAAASLDLTDGLFTNQASEQGEELPEHAGGTELAVLRDPDDDLSPDAPSAADQEVEEGEAPPELAEEPVFAESGPAAPPQEPAVAGDPFAEPSVAKDAPTSDPGAPDAAPRGSDRTPGVEPTQRASSQAPRGTAHSGARSGGGAGLGSLHEVVQERRERVLTLAEARRGALRAGADEQRRAANAAFDVEVGRLHGRFVEAEQQLSTAADTQITNIQADQLARSEAVRAAAETQLAALDGLYAGKEERLRTAASERASRAREHGAAEAARARETCAARVSEAWTACSQTVRAWASSGRAGEIERALNDMTREVTQRVHRAGQDIATDAETRAEELACTFEADVEQAVVDLQSTRQGAVQAIESERGGALAQIDEVSNIAVAQVEQARADAIARLDELGTPALSSIESGRAATLAAIDDMLAAADAQLDAATDSVLAQLDQAEADNTPAFEPLSGLVLEEALSEAATELDGAVARFDADTAAMLTAVREGMTQATVERTSAAAEAVDGASDPLEELITGAVTSFATIADEAANQLGAIEVGAVKGMASLVDGARAELTAQVDAVITGWDERLAEGLTEITARVDQVLADQVQVVAELRTELDDKAREIDEESWFWRGLKFLGGVIMGILERFGEMVIGLIVLALLAVALIVVLVVVGFVVLFFGGPAALLSYIAGLAAIGAFIEAYAVVLVVALAFVVVVLLVIELYTVFTDPHASDHERGAAVGHAIFDVVTAFFGEKIIGWVGKAGSRLARLLGLVSEDAARLARLLALLGGDEARLARLLSAFGDDAARMEAVLARLGNSVDELERLVAIFGDDGFGLERVLGMLGDDVTRLDALIERLGGEALEVERLLGVFGGDAARLEAMVGRFGDDGAAMARSLGAFGDDLTRLETALAAFGDDGARLEAALTAFGDDVARLETALTAFGDDAAKLEQALLAAGNDGAMLDRVWVRLNQDGDRLIAILDAAPDQARAMAFVDGIGDDAARALNDLAPEQLNELLSRDPRILDAIRAKTPEEQATILDDIERIDEVFNPSNNPTTPRAGHAVTEHGPHVPDEYLFDRAANMGDPVSRWNTQAAMDDAIQRAIASTTDPAQVLASRGTDACPVNAQGWRQIDRGRITLQEILDDPVANGRFLKTKVEITGSSLGGGTMFHPDGTTTTAADNFLAILNIDTSSVYRIITAFPTP